MSNELQTLKKYLEDYSKDLEDYLNDGGDKTLSQDEWLKGYISSMKNTLKEIKDIETGSTTESI